MMSLEQEYTQFMYIKFTDTYSNMSASVRIFAYEICVCILF